MWFVAALSDNTDIEHFIIVESPVELCGIAETLGNCSLLVPLCFTANMLCGNCLPDVSTLELEVHSGQGPCWLCCFLHLDSRMGLTLVLTHRV
jgi:hypothetical protein